MAAQEVTLKFRGDPSQIKEVLSDVRSAYGRTLTEIVGISKDITAQINAMWAQRGREISAELAKELEIERAYAQLEVQSSTAAQREVVEAYRQREREAAAIAKSEAAAWAQHEAEQLAATKRAEKEGETIVANANADKVKSSKQTEAQRNKDTKAALADIARMERERAQIAAQNARAIAALAKSEADSRIREGKRAANELINQLKQSIAERVALERRLSQASSGTNAFLAGAAGGVTALFGVSVLSEIRQAGQAWLDYSNKLETTRIAFTTMLGSAQLAEDHLKELQQFALKTPFQFAELIDASQRMQALGFNAQQVIPVLTDVGNAVAAAGGGSERLDRVVLALSQIQSKGKVMTQELNQLAEAGIPAFRILQETLHKSRSEINELVKDGQISSKVFLDAFQKFSQQNFGGLMEAQSRTFSGAMSNIKDALLQTSATAFEPLFQKLSQTAKAFADAATSSKDFQDKLKIVGQVTATQFDGLVELILAFRDAVRLTVSAISAQFTALTEGTKALAHAMAAAFFFAFAVGRQAAGDNAGATRAIRAAQDELALSAKATAKAFESQGEIIKTISTIYKEAEERARKFREEQEKGFAANAAEGLAGAGILRKKPVETEDDLTKKPKGSDPAAAAKRIAEVQLRAVLDGIQLEEEGIERSLKRREIEYARYVAEIRFLEVKRSQAVIAGLEDEQKAANQLRDPNAKAVATAEIEARRVQETNKHQSEINKLTDLTEAHKRKEFEATTDVLRETISAQLKIAEIGDDQRIISIRALAEARVKAEEQAEREILQIRLAAIDRETERTKTEITATGSITDPEEQLKSRAKLNLELRVLVAERVAIEQDGERDIEAARRRDLANERRYADELKTIKQQLLTLQRENAKAVIDSMERHGASRRDIIRAQRTLDTQEENSRHKAALDSISELRRENAESKRTQEEKNQVTAELNQLAEAEAERHRLALEGIANPGGSKSAVDQLFDAINDNLAGNAQTVALAGIQAVTAAFEGLGNAVGQVVESFVLYGSAGTSVRKVTAEILAGVARQAAVKAVFELAEGFAALALAFFGLPNAGPSASAHFTAAAIYAGIAGIAALAGRAVAGDAFKKSVAGGSSGGSSGSSGSKSNAGNSQPKGIELDRATQNQQAITLNVNVKRDAGSIVEVVVDDHRNNGAIRQMVLSEVK